LYAPEGDKRVLVQSDRAHDKAEMRPAGTHGGVRMDGPLFETSDGVGNITFANSEQPLYGDSETWWRWERGSVSPGPRLSHEDWDRRHPEENPNQPMYAAGGSVLGDIIHHFASGGSIGLPPALRLASGGFAGVDAGDGPWRGRQRRANVPLRLGGHRHPRHDGRRERTRLHGPHDWGERFYERLDRATGGSRRFAGLRSGW
jgi:hypothetical protein